MPLRFYRRIRIIPGLRANLSRSGPRVSIGRRGAWFTVGPRGRRATVGLPGTGLFWTEHAPPAAPRRIGRAWPIIIAAIVALVLIATFVLTGCNANQEVNLSSRTAPGVVAGPNFPDYNPYNPISYAQNNTGIGGGGH